jgi:3-hydroxy acid dehydrogenase / malonic semialdehyde reductase
MHGRVALITGATSGIGAACARRFVKEGARVVATGRRQERLGELSRELGAACHTVVLDVRDRDAVERAFADLPADFAAVDVLVNAAGGALGLGKAYEARVEDWDEMIETNVRGLALVTRTALPGMIARGRGHIFNLGSVAGTYPYPGGNVYGATKAFVRQFSLNLRTDLIGTPLRVTDIEPGLCGGTEFSNVRFRGDDEKAANVYANVQPLTAEDIADTIYWIATRPAHVNINTIEMMPVAQAPAGLAVHRG